MRIQIIYICTYLYVQYLSTSLSVLCMYCRSYCTTILTSVNTSKSVHTRWPRNHHVKSSQSLSTGVKMGVCEDFMLGLEISLKEESSIDRPGPLPPPPLGHPWQSLFWFTLLPLILSPRCLCCLCYKRWNVVIYVIWHRLFFIDFEIIEGKCAGCLIRIPVSESISTSSSLSPCPPFISQSATYR
jgi:hypothetical protein